ncbi:MAG: hypothetical protein DMD82_16070 [Candidatus Rokuibacteriota bacterium]|nr:MAG: hypothetical protein DMD82_16070 [Candidatus Rokubacteria bacterium]
MRTARESSVRSVDFGTTRTLGRSRGCASASSAEQTITGVLTPLSHEVRQARLELLEAVTSVCGFDDLEPALELESVERSPGRLVVDDQERASRLSVSPH